MKVEVLIRRCKKKNQNAQRQMVERYSSMLYSVCRRYVRDESFAKDCLQESWIQIFWNLDKYVEQGKWESWITMVTINKCKELLRKKGRLQTEELEEDVIMEDLNCEEVLITDETVKTFLDTLPEKYRMVVNLYLVEEYSHKEIAEFLEISESSSRSLLSRALKMLRETFQEPESNVVQRSTTMKKLRKTIYKKAII